MTSRARRADGDLFQKPNAIDLLAAELDPRSEADATDYLMNIMRDYLNNMSATKRWEFLQAIRLAFGVKEFSDLTRLLREQGVEFEVRSPPSE